MAHTLNVDIWTSVEPLRAHHADWDDLWQRSSTPSPAARAEPLAVWLDHFAKSGQFRAIVVRDGTRFLAALPLLLNRRWHCVGVCGLPKNEWSSAGELLLDSGSADHVAIDELIAAMRQLRCVGVKLDKINPRAGAWQPLFKRLTARNMICRMRRAARVGCVEIASSWEEYEASRSRNHRQQMRKHGRRIREQGDLKLQIVKQFDIAEIAGLLRRGFEVEDRSWKGDAGTSVLRNPGIFEFFCRQAESLARLDHLWLVYLELGGRPIAFEYGWYAKGTYFSPKVGYDAEYARFSPGQLLRYEMLKQFHEAPGPATVDFWGPLTAATERWTTHSYSVVDSTMMPYGTAAKAVRRLGSGAAKVRRVVANARRHLLDAEPGPATARATQR